MSGSLPNQLARETAERREQSSSSSVLRADNSVKCSKCDGAGYLKIQDGEQKEWNEQKKYKELFMRIEGLEKKLRSERKVHHKDLEKKDKEINELYGHLHVSQSEEVKEKLRRTNQTLINQVQESYETIRELEMKVENLQKEVEELHTQTQISAQQNECERYLWKKLLKTQKKQNAKLIGYHGKVMDEKEMLKVEKARLVDILKRQTDSQLRKINELKEQLVRNWNAEQACMELGYSCGIVREAVRIWERRNGYKAADLMKILMELTGELQASHEAQRVSEEKQYQRQPEQLEGAVGGQVVPSGCPFRGHFV